MHFTTAATALLLSTLTLALPTTPDDTNLAATPAPSVTLEPPIGALNANTTLARRGGTGWGHGNAHGGWTYNTVRLCDGANGAGPCFEQSFRHALCYNLDRKWNDRISSIYPQGRGMCRVHVNRDCGGSFVGVGPGWGIQNLKLAKMNDRASSLECWSMK